MAFFKMLTVVVAFATVLLLDLTIKVDACKCLPLGVCPSFDAADVVIRGTALSRFIPTGGDDDITYTLELTTLYKGAPDVSSENKIIFTTARFSTACGVYLELHEEYLLGLYEEDDSLTATSCGLVRQWSSVSDEDKASVETGCVDSNCDVVCGEFQECLFHNDHLGSEYYCADVCDPSPCGHGEKCKLKQLVQCFREPCPPNAVCYY